MGGQSRGREEALSLAWADLQLGRRHRLPLPILEGEVVRAQRTGVEAGTSDPPLRLAFARHLPPPGWGRGSAKPGMGVQKRGRRGSAKFGMGRSATRQTAPPSSPHLGGRGGSRPANRSGGGHLRSPTPPRIRSAPLPHPVGERERQAWYGWAKSGSGGSAKFGMGLQKRGGARLGMRLHT